MGASLNQPSSVKEDCPMGCKLLLFGNKVGHVWPFGYTIRISIGDSLAISRVDMEDAICIRIYWV